MRVDSEIEAHAAHRERRPSDPLVVDMLGEHPLFHGLSEAQKIGLAGLMDEHEASPGAWLFGGPTPDAAALPSTGAMVAVLDGRVELRRHGRRPHLAQIHPGEFFGELHLLRRHPVCEARALSTARLRHIDRIAFTQFLRACPDSALILIQALGNQIAADTQQMAETRFLEPQSRLARLLLRASTLDRFGRRTAQATQKELGEKIGLSRESTNRQMQLWVRAGWIAVQKGKVEILQIERLREVACGL